MDKAVRVRVSGRVQGVGFRYYTCRQGRRRGLTGWVRNEPDGSVLVHIQGPQAVVEDMCHWLENGPPSAHVVDTRLMPAPFNTELIDFDVEY